jgi:hypothetical protein
VKDDDEEGERADDAGDGFEELRIAVHDDSPSVQFFFVTTTQRIVVEKIAPRFHRRQLRAPAAEWREALEQIEFAAESAAATKGRAQLIARRARDSRNSTPSPPRR